MSRQHGARARTWDLVRPHLGDVSERSEPRLYEAAADQLLAIVREIGREIGTLLIIGHNPGLEDLARLLVRSGKRDARVQLKQKYPTAALAVIDCTIGNWRETAPRSGAPCPVYHPTFAGVPGPLSKRHSTE